MPAAPTLVFDLDGTLVDTMGDLSATLNAVLASLGHAPVPPESLGSLFGQGARALLQRGLADNGVTAEPELIETLYARFLDHYLANIAVHSRPFPGVIATLQRFRARGWRCTICTNKPEYLARPLLAALGMTGHFDAIVGSDTFSCAKPHAEPVLGAIARAEGSPARAIMVGDSKTDIDAARAAGIPVVAVTFGYTSVPVEELAPDAIISHFDALDAAVERLGTLPGTAASA
ncbi:phosphoglycolate phosphatase [Stappia taiwanensis]|uniref:Phosphoglycolate phosphatase n=1 Tax=Stappia taiwanensis TaxID=992267 RepID=A0A838XLP9_9HYPH|nr:phosphoglycolate phosphatase [Stappia taiwanensis]MBA4611042.1 phosphoglycolate phosphatase [Stappia taiwanensis]GGE93854.1 phosphoglycolate phosphatase [Stappia taiwanensis]